MSTDNETSAEEDSDVDEMRKNLESMLDSTVSKQTTDTKSNVDTADTTKKTVRRRKKNSKKDMIDLRKKNLTSKITKE